MTAVDPYSAGPARGFLATLNPLATLAAVVPPIVVLMFARNLWTPAAFLILGALVIALGARPTARTVLTLALGLPALMLVLGIAMSLWTDPSRIVRGEAVMSVGDWTLYTGALRTGFATALRLGAMAALALLAGLSSTGPRLVRASVQHLRVPYRIGYTALAAFRFVPRFGYELEVIRQAHRVRGAHDGRGPFAAIGRWWGYVVPLLAGAIRHAERVALAMDARAFGAHPDRTERHPVPLRARDAVFTLTFWAVSLALFFLLWTR